MMELVKLFAILKITVFAHLRQENDIIVTCQQLIT